MREAGFLERNRISPTGLIIVVAMHGAAITALALSKMEMPTGPIFTPLPSADYRTPPGPEPVPEPPQPKQDVRPKSEITYVPPRIPDLPRTDSELTAKPTEDVTMFDPGPIGKDPVDARPADPPKPLPPVRVDAEMLGSSELQPPYPASEERAGNEGRVVIRVTVGTNGRVIDTAKVSATSEAFYRATERHARRAWRFKPATVGGKPVESAKTITVHFRLDS